MVKKLKKNNPYIEIILDLYKSYKNSTEFPYFFFLASPSVNILHNYQNEEINISTVLLTEL